MNDQRNKEKEQRNKMLHMTGIMILRSDRKLEVEKSKKINTKNKDVKK